MTWERIAQYIAVYANQFTVLFGLLFARVLIASAALSVLFLMITAARGKCSPAMRSFLWALCLPVAFIPLERGIIAITKGLGYISEPYGDFPFLKIGGNEFVFLAYIWLSGFITALIIKQARFKKTVKLLKTGRFPGCAAYFYRFRPRIYTTPDFLEVYTESERELLLAHERQHVRQFDPLLYRVLQFFECIFWFNPLIFRAARLIRHDRELLCDERVTRGCSKRDYGMLLLNEAKRAVAYNGIAGIISEPSGIYERVTACVKPLPRKLLFASLICITAAAFFTVGVIGAVYPVTQNPNIMKIYSVNTNGGKSEPVPAEGMEVFISAAADGYYLDERGLYERAAAMGYKDGQQMALQVICDRRITIFSPVTTGGGELFLLGDLKDGEVSLTFAEMKADWWYWLFEIL